MKTRQILVAMTLMLSASACTINPAGTNREYAPALPLLITRHEKSPTTSTGGVGHQLNFTNASTQPYREVAFVFIPYDRFGRRQSSDIDNVDEIQISVVEEIGAGQVLSNNWPDIWFSHQISCVELDRLRVTYSDGAQQVFRKDGVDRMLAPGVGNDCRN